MLAKLFLFETGMITDLALYNDHKLTDQLGIWLNKNAFRPLAAYKFPPSWNMVNPGRFSIPG